MITAEITQSRWGPPTKDQIAELKKNNEDVKGLSKELAKKIRAAVKLSDITPPSPLTPFWSLLSKTPWPTTTTKAESLEGLCAVAFAEAEKGVLEAVRRVLALRYTMDLRFSIWTSTNLWLRWNSDQGRAPELDWWDMCEDQVVGGEMVYQGEMAKKITRLFDEDIKSLKELGDCLTTSSAVANNRDASPADRVISLENRIAIDEFLKVRGSTGSFITC